MTTSPDLRPLHDIAIIGIGCRFPGADDAEAFWANIAAGKASFGPVPRDRWNHDAVFSKSARDVDKTWSPAGAFIDDISSFDPLHYGIAPRRLEVMDPQHRLLIEAVRVAIQDAGYETRAFERKRTGVFVGASVSEYKNMMSARLRAAQIANGDFGPAAASEQTRAAILEMAGNIVPTRAFSIAGVLTNMAAASVSQTFDLGGPSFAIDAACASASVATHDALAMLRSNAIDLAIASGVYVNLTPDNLIGFTRVGAISPTGACRPYAADADGFVQGDGIGVLLLKRVGEAVRDGDRIYAVIRGSGCNNDGRAEGPMTPRAGGQLDSLHAAYEDAGVSPATVAYFEGHGTGTSVGDPIEVEALGRLLDGAGVPKERPALLGSVKGNVGHTMSAAGIAGLIKAVKVIEHRAAPPQPSFTKPHAKLGLERWPLQISTDLTPLDGAPLRVGVSSFGFGGTNSHIVLEEAPPTSRASATPDLGPQALLITAPTPELLATHLLEVASTIERTQPRLSDLAYTLNACRKYERYRAVLAVTDLATAARAMGEAARALDGASAFPVIASSEAAIHDSGAPDAERPKVAFMFAGQGAQRPGLLGAIRERFGGYRKAFDTLTASTDPLLDRPLSSYLYPDRNDAAAATALTATEVCQPAMAASGLALASVLESLGVSADVSLGHSLGEFAALAHGGALDPAAAVRLVAIRGKAMRDLGLEDTGAMAAVFADRSVVAELIADIDGVTVANVNRPGQVTISGTSGAVQAAVDRMSQAGLRVDQLRVSHAFHSPLLEGIAPTITAALAEVEWRPLRHVVASCVAGRPYDDDAQVTTKVLQGHATAPVDFVAALGQAHDAGASVFVQIGGGRALSSFAGATLGTDRVQTISLAPSDDDGGIGFLRGLATLAAIGVDVRFAALYCRDHQVVTLPATPLDRQRYWVVRQERQPQARQRFDPAAGARFGTIEAEVSGAVATPIAAPTEAPNADMVALFHRQAAILEQHAQILADQTRALLGAGAAVRAEPPPAPVLTPPPAPVEARVAEILHEPPAKDDPAAASARVSETVLEIVAKVSAFPQDSLRRDQKLVDELGFDSLMVADLGAALDKAYPALGGLPQTLFSTKTTVGDLADHVAGALAAPVEAAAPASADLSVYQPIPVARPAPDLGLVDIAGEAWLVTAEPGATLDQAIACELTAAGAEVTNIALISDSLERPAPSPGARTSWSLDAVSALPGQLEGPFSGHIHVAGSHRGANGSYHNPLAWLHPLVQSLPVRRRCVVTAMGGKLGLEPGAGNVLHAALAGYGKSLARERRTEIVRVLDVDPAASAKTNAEWLVEELRGADRTCEVGSHGGQRWVSHLAIRPSATAHSRVGSGDVVLITGGAGEIAALVARDLAAAKPKGLVLLGRREATSEIQALIAELSRAGTVARYVSADVTDATSIASAVAGVRESIGAVTIAVHAAGVIDDAPIEALSLDRIDAVMRVKILGYAALRQALPQARALVVFSSWAGRFGNAHQAPYAAANDLLDRLAIADTSDAQRVTSIDWPPWSSTRMVASIPTTIRNAMLAEGVTFVEDGEGVQTARALIAGDGGLYVVGRALPQARASLVVEEKISLERHPYLDDHRLAGAPVVPLAAATDLVTWVARSALGDAAISVEELELIRGIDASEEVAVAVCLDGKVDGTAAVEIYAGGELAYRAKARAGGEVSPVTLRGDDEALPFDVPTFYRAHTFHGPRLAGIDAIERMTSQGIAGVVHPTPVAAWIPGSDRETWAADPLILDSSFQLAGYWALVHHRRAGFPIGFERFTVLAPFGDQPLRCCLVLDEAEEDRFRCTLRYERLDGTAVAIVERLEGRLAEVASEVAVEERPDVPREHYDIAAFSEVETLDQRLQMAALMGLDNPYFNVHEGTAKNRSVINGVEMLNYSSYNYLGFSGHAEVVAAAKAAIDTYGTSVSASRVASGERPIHRQLEVGIAEHIGVEDSIVFVSGHATNVTTVGHMLSEGDIIIHDALIHDSILQGIYLSGAARRPYPHEDLGALERILDQTRHHHRRALICAEGIYSMDGDICDLPRLIELKKRFGCMLLVDEAHSAGVLGPAGSGIAHHFDGVDPKDVDMWMGTLSKSYASCGGYIAGSDALVRYLKYTAPGFVYSAGITPPNAAAALASLALMKRHPEVVQQLRDRSMLFLETAKARGLDTGLAMGAAVVPIIVGNSLDCVKLSAALGKRQINVQPIVYPAVEDDAARLRFFISSTHTEAEIRETIEIVADELANVRAASAGNTLSL